VTDETVQADEPVDGLGLRLRAARMKAGLSLRELSRQLGVSPSFVSQVENGKSQPSVATLYAIAQLLGVSIDQLFRGGPEAPTNRPDPVGPVRRLVPAVEPELAPSDSPVNRSNLSTPAQAWIDPEHRSRLSVLRADERPRLVMDSGVIWEQLATNTGSGLDFIEIIYPPRSSSTNNNTMLQHPGYEYGYLLDGELEITVGFDVFTLSAGESIGFDSGTPHLLRNLTDNPARGIWFISHP
jgi:transcriptional regulator with XRE-family HTH domain